MKKNTRKSYENLMSTRDKELSFLYGDQPMTDIVLRRLMTLKGIKRFYYTLMFIVENEVENKDVYRVEFEFTITQWLAGRITSTQLENRAAEIILKEVKIVDCPPEKGYIPFEEIK